MTNLVVFAISLKKNGSEVKLLFLSSCFDGGPVSRSLKNMKGVCQARKRNLLYAPSVEHLSRLNSVQWAA